MILENALNIILSLSIPWLMGFAFLSLLFPDRTFPFWPKVALSYGLGFGVLTQYMLLLGILKIPYSKETLDLPLLGLTICVSFFNAYQTRRTQPQNLKTAPMDEQTLKTLCRSKPALTIFKFLLTIIIIYYALLIFWKVWAIPFTGFDTFSWIALKAKVFFFHPSLKDIINAPHFSYPLHLPFTLAYFAFNIGSWQDHLLQSFLPFTFLSYLVIQHYFLRTLTDDLWSLTGVILLISSSFLFNMAGICYADFPLLYYNCTALILLILWQREPGYRLLILAGLFSGFATFVKFEGTAYWLIHIALLVKILMDQKDLSLNQKVKSFFLFSGPSFVLTAGFYIVKAIFQAPLGKHFIAFNIDVFHRPLIIAKTFLIYTFPNSDWNIIWFLLLLSYISSWGKEKSPETRLLSLSLFMFFGLYFLAALLTSEYAWLAGPAAADVLPRLFLHFFPLADLSFEL